MCRLCQIVACERFLQDKLDPAGECESHMLRCFKDTGGSGEPYATLLNSSVSLTAHDECNEVLLRRFSELADRYWNGPTTLLKNPQFRS